MQEGVDLIVQGDNQVAGDAHVVDVLDPEGESIRFWHASYCADY